MTDLQRLIVIAIVALSFLALAKTGRADSANHHADGVGHKIDRTHAPDMVLEKHINLWYWNKRCSHTRIGKHRYFTQNLNVEAVGNIIELPVYKVLRHSTYIQILRDIDEAEFCWALAGFLIQRHVPESTVEELIEELKESKR